MKNVEKYTDAITIKVDLLVRKAVDFCIQAGTPIEKLALQFAVHREDIPTTLVSTPNPQEMLNNIEWATQAPDWELIREVQKILESVMNKDWIVG